MKGLKTILWVSWTAKKTNEWVLNKGGVKRELVDTVKARKLAYYDHTMGKQGSCLEKEIMQEQCQVHAREEGHARPGWITRRGQDCPWKSQSEWQRTGINGDSTSMVWPTLGSRTAKEQNRTDPGYLPPPDITIADILLSPVRNSSVNSRFGIHCWRRGVVVIA